MKILRTFGTLPDAIPEGLLARLTFPVLAWLDEWTTDGRMIVESGFSTRELPLSVMLKTVTSPGHDGAEVAGRIDMVEVVQDDQGRKFARGYGFALDDPVGERLVKLNKAGALRGNSVDLSVASEDVEEVLDPARGDLAMLFPKLKFNKVQLSATTVVPTPAFEGATVEVDDAPDLGVPTPAMVAAVEEVYEAMHVTFTDTATLARPSRALFADPALKVPTPLRVTENGEVYGHIALWNSRHLNAAVPPPRSRTNYSYFLTGQVLTEDGMVATGRLVIGGAHAGETLGWREAIDHYADVSAAWADVACGEDAHGIWVAGMVRPGVDELTLRTARGSGTSGDWRLLGGNLELVAILSVNAGAFPVPTSYAENGVALSTVGIGLGPETTQPVGAFSADLGYVASRLRRDEVREIASEVLEG